MIALLLVSAPTRAEDPLVERKYRSALELRARGEDQAALAILRDIEATAPSGRSIAQVALAEQATGAWVRAEEDLQLAFQRGGEWVSRNKGVLDGSLATIEEHLGSLEIVCDACAKSQARATVDGVDRGTPPFPHPLRLELGRH